MKKGTSSIFTLWEKATKAKKQFSHLHQILLPLRLRNFHGSLICTFLNVRRDEGFKNLKNLLELSVKLVDTQKDEQYYVVYKILKLVLILPIATASVERVFSMMNYVQNKQRNKMGDEYLNNCLATFIENEFFSQVKDKDIINLFQQGDRRIIL